MQGRDDKTPTVREYPLPGGIAPAASFELSRLARHAPGNASRKRESCCQPGPQTARARPLWGLWSLAPGPLLTGPTLLAKLGEVADFLGRQPLHRVPVWTTGIAVVIGFGVLPVYANDDPVRLDLRLGSGPGVGDGELSAGDLPGPRDCPGVAFQRVDPLISPKASRRNKCGGGSFTAASGVPCSS